MHSLDFLSDSPRIFIFQKEANKTNFGGVLFLIYAIVMILISLAYILDYALNEKYTYEAISFYNHTDNEEEINKMNDDKELNPYLELTISLKNDNFSLMDKRVSEVDFLEKDHIDKEGNSIYKIRDKANNFELIIFFFCGEDKNCASIELNKWNQIGNIKLEYPGYKIDHFNDPPIYKDKNKIFEIGLFFEESYEPKVYFFDWEVIKYKDQKSVFDTFTNKKTEYTFGHLKNDKPETEFLIDDIKDFINEWNIKGKGHFLPLFAIGSKNNHDQYLLYKRKKVSFLDVLANIGALFSTIKTCFSIFFSFYSKNFNNYKIIGKLFDSPKVPIKNIELSQKSEENMIFNEKEEEKEKMNEIKNSEPLIDKTQNDFNIKTKDFDINEDIEENNVNKSSSFSLRKLHFYDFFINNFYSKCFKRRRNQEIINMANDIIYKYLSIDSLLYNQIKLESLFKDYKWNNPILNDIQTNQMIIKLKNI